MTTKDAVLLSCHGTVEHMSDMPEFLKNIRRGRPAPPELLAEMVHRYERIGGSPLMAQSRAMAETLEATLGVPVRVAGRLFHPYPGAVLAELAGLGARRVVSLPLAPQSVHVYHASVREAAAPLGLEIEEVDSYGTDPDVVAACVETIDAALEGTASKPPVVLSAHSLPVRIIQAGDPYERDFRAMAAAVGGVLAERGSETRVAFQSQGATQDTWLGPDLPATFADLAAAGHREVVVAPIGFVSEHVETLYDLDLEAPALALAAGLTKLYRAPAMGTRPRFVKALEKLAREALARPSAAAG
jgi:ferrochelatase